MGDTVKDKQEENRRVQLKHVLLDVDLPNHNKIRMLQRIHNVNGKCSLYEVYAAMAKATNAVIEKELIIIIAEDNDVANPEGFFEYCLEKGLIRAELDGYSNDNVIKDQESLYKTQERWRKTRRQKEENIDRPRTSSVAAALQPRCNRDDAARKSEILNIEVLNIDLLNKDLKKSGAPPPGKVKILDFLEFDEISLEQWRATLGEERLKRACEKLNGWIGQAKGTPDFEKRLIRGKNASYALQNWVAREVQKEVATSPPTKVKKSKAEEILALGAIILEGSA
jgi:hypothetical protein